MAAFILASYTVTAVALFMNKTSEHDVPCGIITAFYSISFLLMCVMTIRVTKSDPTDPTVALERLARIDWRNKMAKIDFDPKNYNFFCEVCDTHVLKNTKHCQRCNRCSYEFDHHCVWVSNDIGLHNYIDFMRMLTAVFFTVISHFTLCVYTLATLKNISNEAYVGYMTRKSLESLNWATIAILVILAILDTYLLIFHVYLICINTSTYKHMRRKQKRGKSRIIVELEN